MMSCPQIRVQSRRRLELNRSYVNKRESMSIDDDKMLDCHENILWNTAHPLI